MEAVLTQLLLNVCFVRVVASPSAFVTVYNEPNFTERVLVREYYKAVPCDDIMRSQSEENAKRARELARQLNDGDKK